MGEDARCKRCDEPPVEGKKQCQRHLDQQKEWNARQYANKKESVHGGSPVRPTLKPAVKKTEYAPACTVTVQEASKPATSLIPRKPKSSSVVESVVVSAAPLDEAITKLREDLSALERAKAILERAIA